MAGKFLSAVVLTLAVGLFAAVGVVNAQSFRSGDNVAVDKTETIDGSLYVAGSNININGTINGDVYCAGQNVMIDATVNGDVLCAAQNLTVRGRVDGDVRLAGQTVQLDGDVSKNATVAAQGLTLAAQAKVGGDLTGGAEKLSLLGTIGRDLTLGATKATISGTVGRNVNSELEHLELTSTAKIGGNLTYKSQQKAVVSKNAKVGGETKQLQPEQAKSDKSDNGRFGFYMVLASLVTALVLVGLMPKTYALSAALATRSWGKTLLFGLLAVIGLPIVLLVLLLTLLGIPLAIVVLLLWIAAAIASGSFFAYFIGRIIWKDQANPLLLVLLGVAVVSIISWIPVLGWIISVVGFVFGMGMILRALWNGFRPSPDEPYVKKPGPKIRLAKAK